MSESDLFLGIDLGGTNVKAGVVNDSGQTVGFASLPTEAERGPDHGINRMVETAQDAMRDAQIDKQNVVAVGLATPGTMDIPQGMLLEPHNLPGWIDIPIRRIIQERLDLPTILQNDANAAAYGEYWVGAGREAHSMVFWTLGTGLGCGIIVGDMVIEGRHSHGSECGHMIVQMDDGRLCASGHYGELEAYVSATALVQQCRRRLDEGHSSAIRARLDAGETLSPLLMTDCAEHGDDLCRNLIMECARYLGVGTTSLMHTIDPDMVLLGGAMTFGRHQSEIGRGFLSRVQEEVRHRAFPVPYENTLIDYASLGSDAGYVGAAGCARRSLSNS